MPAGKAELATRPESPDRDLRQSAPLTDFRYQSTLSMVSSKSLAVAHVVQDARTT